MAHNLPLAGTVTALFNVTFIFPVIHEIELLAESKLPLLSYNAALRLSPPQLAPTSMVIVSIVPAARPVNKLPKGVTGLGCVLLLKTPVYPLSTLEEAVAEASWVESTKIPNSKLDEKITKARIVIMTKDNFCFDFLLVSYPTPYF